MENTTNLSKRIKQLIDYKGITLNKFSIQVGASNSYFNKVLKENSSIGSDRIERILRVFPEVNAEWLLTGQGEMLKNESEKQEENSSDKELIEMQKKLLKSQSEQI